MTFPSPTSIIPASNAGGRCSGAIRRAVGSARTANMMDRRMSVINETSLATLKSKKTLWEHLLPQEQVQFAEIGIQNCEYFSFEIPMGWRQASRIFISGDIYRVKPDYIPVTESLWVEYEIVQFSIETDLPGKPQYAVKIDPSTSIALYGMVHRVGFGGITYKNPFNGTKTCFMMSSPPPSEVQGPWVPAKIRFLR